MEKVNKDFKYLIWLWSILILAIILTYAHHGHLIIDSGREVYYPTQILLGKVLYKDLFNIYGPFSYMFNAFLFKLFGINLNVLYLAGCVCAFLITSLIYLISKRFLSKFLSFSISVFTIVIGVLNLNLFNFIFPYSYGMLYGITAFLISFLFLLKYEKAQEKNLYLYLSCFFAGLCLTSKYEFLPYLVVILYAAFKIKPLKFKQYYFLIFSLLFVPIFCFGILFLQGLGVNDLILTAEIIKKMALSQTLKYFYDVQGAYFSIKVLKVLFCNLLGTLIPLSFFVYGFRIKNKILSVITIFISVILIFQLANPASFVFFPVLIIILSVLNFKNLIKNSPFMLLALAGITISLKSFWGLATLNYGAFFISFLTITFFTLLLESFKNKNIQLNQNVFGIYILIVAMVFGIHNLFMLQLKNYPIQTPRGKIYFYKREGVPTQELINYINKNTKRTDKIVILPEGLVINFLTDRKSDDYYNSLIPLYIETFGEEKLIEHFKKTKPDYIIFNNWNTKDYYFKYICADYALGFCEFVNSNYIQKNIIDNEFRYLIYKRAY